MRKGSLTLVVLMTGLVWLGAQQPAPETNVIADVRAAIAEDDFEGAEQILDQYRTADGTTLKAIAALSWLGRGALAADKLDRAEQYALEAYDLAVAELDGRSPDEDRDLEIGLGAAIEVQAHVQARRGARSDAVYFLRREIDTYGDSVLHKRIQKNINLLSLEGQVAPAIEAAEHLGRPAPSAEELDGKVVILFFWAHWCPDCKAESPILATLLDKYRSQGLEIVAPTQRYGFIGRRRDVGSDEELQHIHKTRDSDYAFLRDEAVPVSEASHKRYGVSTTPTVVLVDRQGIVRLYHPGQMTEAELEAAIRPLL